MIFVKGERVKLCTARLQIEYLCKKETYDKMSWSEFFWETLTDPCFLFNNNFINFQGTSFSLLQVYFQTNKKPSIWKFHIIWKFLERDFSKLLNSPSRPVFNYFRTILSLTDTGENSKLDHRQIWYEVCTVPIFRCTLLIIFACISNELPKFS